jgi:alanyl-tRNA synthetase
LRGQKREVDTAGFEEAMNRQREDARQAWKGSGEAATDRLWFELRERIGATEFLGYDTTRAEGIVTALVKSGESVGKAETGEMVQLLANQTPFYGESGGQTGDTGTITTSSGAKLRVTSTEKKLGVLFVHTGTVESGTLGVGEAIDLRVDNERRDAIRANHSATHLLHEALRRRLGEHVAQKGSYVGPDRLRFDVSQPVGLTAEDIAVVERDVNRRIRGNTAVVTRIMGVKDAMEQGAMALFGEKYGEEVRVVSMGGRDEGANKDYSVELCGGTHVARTGDIGLLKIVAESAVAAGIRRIEAVTGEGALAYLDDKLALLDRAAASLKASPTEIPARIEALMEDRKTLTRDVSDLRRRLAVGETGGQEARHVNGIPLVSRVANDVPSKDLKPMADALKKQTPGAVIVLAGSYEGKLSVLVSVAEELTGRFNAIDLVRVAAEAAGGKGGGGRPDMAQAGGPDASRAGEAVAAVEKVLQAG